VQEYGAGIAEYFVEYSRELKQHQMGNACVRDWWSDAVCVGGGDVRTPRAHSTTSATLTSATMTTTTATGGAALTQELLCGDLDVLLYDADAIDLNMPA
jgi:hypothetical protein